MPTRLAPWIAIFATLPLLGPAAAAAGSPTFGEVGANDFRISVNEGTGDPDYDAVSPAVAYNPNADEYLVVWAGHEDCGVFVGENREIFAQRIGGNGAPVGPRIGVSRVGPDCDPDYIAHDPAVAYNATEDEYLVVWWGDDNVGGLVQGELEIFGQRVVGDGTLTGAEDFRISDAGGTGSLDGAASHPAVAWNGTENEYLVVWSGSDPVGGMAPGELEVFGQRLSGAGAEIGANDFRISDAGGTGDPSFRVLAPPSVAWNAAANEFLVVWAGEDDVGGLVDEEYEIFGQRLDENGTPQGANDFRISDMGGTGDPSYGAVSTDVVWNATENVYLVVWAGDDNVGGLVAGENEIFGQQLDASGIQMAFNDFRISDMGDTGDPSYDAAFPAVIWDSTANEYLVVWHGDDNAGGGLAEGELEIFGQRLDAANVVPPLPPVGANDFRISDMGGSGANLFRAFLAAVAYDQTRDEYLVVWTGDDDVGGLVLGELEIFGQRLGATLIFADGFESGDAGAWDSVVP